VKSKQSKQIQNTYKTKYMSAELLELTSMAVCGCPGSTVWRIYETYLCGLWLIWRVY